MSDLIGRMTLEEKTAQLYGVWVGADTDGDGVAPHQNDMVDPVDWDTLITRGLGQLTRPFGTAPVDPATGALALARAQRRIVEANRFGIPALTHEECLAGFTAWGATAYPVPLAWGAAFDPELVTRMARRIGDDLRSVGVHQGLAPVLDVVRDLRWGRVEETVGEDPYLVATIGTAYVRGLESAGVVATLKHFAGYSASAGARNLAPVRAGARELADVILPVRDGPARRRRPLGDALLRRDRRRPRGGRPRLLTGLLRDDWGFTGTVVADYFGIGFLETLHKVAADRADAARVALAAGVDVELPTVRSYGEALVAAVRDGAVPEALVDRALRRVLLQKCALGLLDADWSPLPPSSPAPTRRPHPRRCAAPWTSTRPPTARRPGCSPSGPSSCSPTTGSAPAGRARPRRRGRPPRGRPPRHAGLLLLPRPCGRLPPRRPRRGGHPHRPRRPHRGVPRAAVRFAEGCDVTGPDTSRIADAVALARDADVCVAVVGDRAGLFGRGTSGRGATPPTCPCPASRASCWTPSSPRAHPSSPSW
ncbi:glycoside hydrolase family 3 protein [Streptomyces zhihengii]